MTNPAGWLGGYEPLEAVRTRAEAKQKLASVPKANRSELTGAE